ncbi:MAG: nucleotidyl transferase AbiEii/AbiGii toxin family protein [Nanoarchaeota archaeon]|nr:nucleotidyl transferase AbiEii/AbiGii toxin family protein [Nanoarchaeota archaeon]
MDEIKRISSIDFNTVVSEHNFQRDLLLKDYYLTRILYSLKDVNGIYFKGGTALNKIFLNHTRLSEDVDFTLTRNEKEVGHEIIDIIRKLDFFKEYKEGKNVDGFIRIIVNCSSELGNSELFIDLNQRGKLSLPSEIHKVKHFYSPFIPEFSVKTLAREELIAEKVAASIGRNKPRDHFDVYQIIHANMPINIELVKKKCADSGDEFSIIKMFNKAQTLKDRWDKDMVSLISEPVSFQEVIQFLAKHFKLKKAKDKVKKGKKVMDVKSPNI